VEEESISGWVTPNALAQLFSKGVLAVIGGNGKRAFFPSDK
jgi:hypothetical protein